MAIRKTRGVATPAIPTSGLLDDWRNDMIAAAGEFIGTVLFLMFGLGAVQAVSANLQQNTSDSSSTTPLGAQGSDAARLFAFFYIAAAFGFGLFATASIFYRFTGSIFNPNVSLALVLCGVIKPFRFLVVCTAQMVGGIVASAIIDGLTPGSLSVNVALGGGTSRTQGLFIEMFTTAALVLSVLMLAAEKHLLTPFAPLGFGMTLFVVMLFSVEFTGGAVNTARAFGPACIQGFANYHWIYWLGPTMGALLATAFYIFLKSVHYWRINPDQDSTDERDAPMAEV